MWKSDSIEPVLLAISRLPATKLVCIGRIDRRLVPEVVVIRWILGLLLGLEVQHSSRLALVLPRTG